jgi:hypothetical protein
LQRMLKESMRVVLIMIFFARNYDYVVVTTQADRWTEDAGKYHTGYFVVDSFINDSRFNQTYTPVYQQKIGAIFKRIENQNPTRRIDAHQR